MRVGVAVRDRVEVAVGVEVDVCVGVLVDVAVDVAVLVGAGWVFVGEGVAPGVGVSVSNGEEVIAGVPANADPGVGVEQPLLTHAARTVTHKKTKRIRTDKKIITSRH
ncbi:MAG TPA: hypothetical protein VIX58_13970 [Anaerolineae bacterium]